MKNGIKRVLAWMLALCVAMLCGTALAAGDKTLTAEIAVEIAVKGVAPSPAETYTVRMTAKNANNPMPGGGFGGTYDLKITGPSTKTFPAMTFDKLGVYSYTIEQVPGTNPKCVLYDPTVYDLTVYVTREGKGSDLSLTAVLSRPGDTDKPDKCVFENVYPTPVTHDPPVKKIITGDTPSSDATFTFKLTAKSNTAGYAVNDMPMPNGAKGPSVTITTTGAQEKEFGLITFDKAGTYVYEVSEVNSGADGYTYDTSVYTLTYEITLNMKTYEYEKKLTVTKNGVAYDKSAFEFTNTYTKPTTPSSGDNDAPKTGVQDNWPYYLGGAALLVLAAFGLMLYYRKRRSN